MKNLLAEIGWQLDQSIFPVVKNGGFVLPSESASFLNPLGKENYHEPERQNRPTTEPRPGTIGKPWPPGETPPVLGPDEGTIYRETLNSVCDAYPGTRKWDQGEGFWLYTESALLPELGRKASFITGVSIARRTVRSWGFWNSSVAGATWIGPRHTNFPDGSICAYEPGDGTWVFGDSLVELLDLYSVWALRHFHYEFFGRWPGPQAVAHPYERLLELADDEHCGCGISGKRYADCCKDADSRRNRIAEAIKFGFFSCWSLRYPPRSVLQFMQDGNRPPKISELV